MKNHTQIQTISFTCGCGEKIGFYMHCKFQEKVQCGKCLRGFWVRASVQEIAIQKKKIKG